QVAHPMRWTEVPGAVDRVVRGPLGIRGYELPAPHTPRSASRHDRLPSSTFPLMLRAIPALLPGVTHPLMPGGMLGAVPLAHGDGAGTSRHRARPTRCTRHGHLS